MFVLMWPTTKVSYKKKHLPRILFPEVVVDYKNYSTPGDKYESYPKLRKGDL